MTPSTSIIAKLLNVKYTHIDKVSMDVFTKQHDNQECEYEKIVVLVRPWESAQNLCPICREKCPGYDTKQEHASSWRGPNLNGVRVELQYQPKRIECPEHGVQTEWIPWQDGKTRSLPDFNNEVAWWALQASRTAVTVFMDVNWRTVGNCIAAAHDRIEPDPKQRLHGLRRICVDETSWVKGHKYITVVYDMDRNRVVWCCCSARLSQNCSI